MEIGDWTDLWTLRLQGNPLGAAQLVQLEQCTRLRYSGGTGSGLAGDPDEGVGVRVGAEALCVASIDERQATMLREERDGP